MRQSSNLRTEKFHTMYQVGDYYKQYVDIKMLEVDLHGNLNDCFKEKAKKLHDGM